MELMVLTVTAVRKSLMIVFTLLTSEIGSLLLRKLTSYYSKARGMSREKKLTSYCSRGNEGMLFCETAGVSPGRTYFEQRNQAGKVPIDRVGFEGIE